MLLCVLLPTPRKEDEQVWSKPRYQRLTVPVNIHHRSKKRKALQQAIHKFSLKQPPLRHRQHRGPGHDEMIQQPDIDQRQRLLQMLGQRDIRMAGFSQPPRSDCVLRRPTARFGAVPTGMRQGCTRRA